MSKTGEMIKKPRLGIFLELWAMMMGLVLLTVGCMWCGQVLFLEKNYADATLASPDGSLIGIYSNGKALTDTSSEPEFHLWETRLSQPTRFWSSLTGWT